MSEVVNIAKDFLYETVLIGEKVCILGALLVECSVPQKSFRSHSTITPITPKSRHGMEIYLLRSSLCSLEVLNCIKTKKDVLCRDLCSKMLSSFLDCRICSSCTTIGPLKAQIKSVDSFCTGVVCLRWTRNEDAR